MVVKIVIVDPDYIHNFLVTRAFMKLGYCDCFEIFSNIDRAKEYCDQNNQAYGLLFCQNEYYRSLNNLIEKSSFSICLYNNSLRTEMIDDLGTREVYFVEKPFVEEKLKYLIHNFKQSVS